MSDTPTAGEQVTKQRMLNSFIDNVEAAIEGVIVWDSGNTPSGVAGQTLTDCSSSCCNYWGYWSWKLVIWDE